MKRFVLQGALTLVLLFTVPISAQAKGYFSFDSNTEIGSGLQDTGSTDDQPTGDKSSVDYQTNTDTVTLYYPDKSITTTTNTAYKKVVATLTKMPRYKKFILAFLFAGISIALATVGRNFLRKRVDNDESTK